MKKSAILFISLLAVLSCGKLKGDFAFQTPDDKSYRINRERHEFSASEEIKWIYKFRSIPSGTIKLGVIILKKELGWIDVLTISDYIDPKKSIIYGTLKELEPGDYKIVIVEPTPDGNKTIDEKEVYIYSDEELPD